MVASGRTGRPSSQATVSFSSSADSAATGCSCTERPASSISFSTSRERAPDVVGPRAAAPDRRWPPRARRPPRRRFLGRGGAGSSSPAKALMPRTSSSTATAADAQSHQAGCRRLSRRSVVSSRVTVPTGWGRSSTRAVRVHPGRGGSGGCDAGEARRRRHGARWPGRPRWRTGPRESWRAPSPRPPAAPPEPRTAAAAPARGRRERHRDRGLPHERAVAREALVEHHAQRVDVAAGVHVALGLLGDVLRACRRSARSGSSWRRRRRGRCRSR